MPRIIKPATGSFTTADISVDSQGRIFSAATGSAGGGVNIAKNLFNSGSGNWTANPGANSASAFIKGCGGGGGGYLNNVPSPQGPGKSGGDGGYGYYFGPVTGGTSYAYAVGAGGGGGGFQQTGQAGGASQLTNIGTANGGGGGPAGPGNTNAGSAPGAQADFTGNDGLMNPAGAGGAGTNTNGTGGSGGQSGFILVYDNSGSV